MKRLLHIFFCFTLGIGISHGANNNITSFTMPGQIGATRIDSSGSVGRVDITMPIGTNVKTITPGITSSGISYRLLWKKGTEFNTNGSPKCPHYYEVTASNNAVKQWEIYFTAQAATEAAIYSFTFTNQVGSTVYKGDSILINMPSGTNSASLLPIITYSGGANIVPAANLAQDFSSVKIYTITSQDGNTTRSYKVKVTVIKNTACNINEFSINGIYGVCTKDSIYTVTLPEGSSVTALTPVFTIATNATAVPASGIVQNFTNPIYYTITAENGVNKKRYKVIVYVTPPIPKSDECIIRSFKINGYSGAIKDSSITINNLPAGTSLTALMPSILISAKATVSPDSGVVQNFSNPMLYTVTAENRISKKRYWVTVKSKDMTSVENALYKQLRIYPNPVKGVLHIDLPVAITKIELHNMSGTLVKQGKGNEMEVSNLPNGNYIITLYLENKVVLNRKITISK